MHHLLKQLRMRGVFDPSEIEVGIMESNGHLSILKKSQFQPVMAKDLNLSSQGAVASQFVSKELVVDGEATINPYGTLYVDKKRDQAPLNQRVKK